MTQSQTGAADLLQAAHDAGQLSTPALQALSLVDVGANMNAALGTPALDVRATETTIVALLIDDSGSIEEAGNVQTMIDGANIFLDEFAKDRNKDGILLHMMLLNGAVVNAFALIENVQRLNSSNYRATGGTPLYRSMLELLGAVQAKKFELESVGTIVRTVTFMFTDGADLHSGHVTAQDVAKVVKDMRLREGEHIIAGMGISDGRTDFAQVFRDMGLTDAWIYTTANDPREIRRGFQMASQSAAVASQSAGSFSATALGGFGGN